MHEGKAPKVACMASIWDWCRESILTIRFTKGRIIDSVSEVRHR